MNWYLNFGNDETIGPATTAQVMEWILNGRVKQDTLACLTGEKEWRPIGQIKHFVKAFEYTPPPPPVSLGVRTKQRDDIGLLLALLPLLAGLSMLVVSSEMSMVSLLILCAVFVGIDAAKLGFGKDKNDKHSALKTGPAAWAVGQLLLWIVAYPWYMLSRKHSSVSTANYGTLSIVVMVFYLAVYVGVFAMRQDDQTAQAEFAGLQQQLETIENERAQTQSALQANGLAPESAPEQPQDDGFIRPGMYKIGVDLPAGEYILAAINGQDAYYQLAKDSTGGIDSILDNDLFSSTRYVKVRDGEYLTFQNCLAAEAEKINPQSHFKNGMYKVGKDIEPGEYKVSAIGGNGYLEVSRNSRGGVDNIVNNDNFDGERYVTVRKGQYLKLSNAEILRQ